MSRVPRLQGPDRRLGWCPTLRRPLESGDGWLVRVAAPVGGLDGDRARLLARVAREEGNGLLDLTGRGNLQVRGVRCPEAAADRLAEAGFQDPPRVLASPLCGVDPACDPGARDLADQLERVLAAMELPDKFLCVVDGGGLVPMPVRADLYLAPLGGNYRPAPPPPLRRVPLGRLGPATALGVPFGSLAAAALERLADRADRVLPAPGRVLLVPDLQGEPGPEFLTDPDDPRRLVEACPGAPACSRAAGPTRDLALDLAALARGRRIHVSGCPKGCAWPREAEVAVTASPGGYDLALGSRADGVPSLRSLTPAQVMRELA